MSQHHFYTLHQHEKTHILMGYDRPLQGFFLVIEKTSDGDYPFWSNLDQPVSHPKQLGPFLDILHGLNIQLPDQMIAEIIQDAKDNIGNKQVLHQLTPYGVYQRVEGVIPSDDVGIDYDTLS